VKPASMQWNGKKWSLVRVRLPRGSLSGSLAAVACASPADCIAVGSYETAFFGIQSLAEHWNGHQWAPQSAKVLPAKSSNLNGVSCPGKMSCFAVGEEENKSGQYVNIAEHWNGAHWKAQPTSAPAGVQGSNLASVSCHANGSCLAAGYTYSDNQSLSDTLAQQWNGSKWTPGLPANPSKAADSISQLSGVACPGASNCAAVGFYDLTSNAAATLAEHWNGTAWTVVKTPKSTAPAGNVLRAIACAGASKCIAVGNSRSSPDNTGYGVLAERWNGSKWTLMKTPAP
jgi:hypothetical protein